MEDYPSDAKNFCSDCGSATIHKCPSCSASIRGDEDWGEAFGYTTLSDIPNFCHNCGSAYPWTEKSVEAIQELLEFEDNLNEEEKRYL